MESNGCGILIMKIILIKWNKHHNKYTIHSSRSIRRNVSERRLYYEKRLHLFHDDLIYLSYNKCHQIVFPNDILCFNFIKVLLWQISVTTHPHVFVIATCIWSGEIVYLLVNCNKRFVWKFTKTRHLLGFYIFHIDWIERKTTCVRTGENLWTTEERK